MIKWLHDYSNMVNTVYISAVRDLGIKQTIKNHNPDMKQNKMRHGFKLLMKYKKR